MTNGEKIKELFPTFEFIKETEKDRTPQHQFLKVYGVNKVPYMEFDLGWWNAEYKEPTTKNDLGVDCISRKAAEDITWQDPSYTDPLNILTEVRDKIRELPSVTPIKPKGHWILTDVEGNRVWHCNCSECGKDPQDYVGGSENWWLIKSKLPKFCPSCGSDNSEGEE